MISGRRVSILTKNGMVKGVTGKRAIHLMSAEDRKKVPETHQIWIDIGVSSREEAEALVRIGDCAVYDQGFELIRGSIGVARAFDDKAGAYAVLEAVRRLATGKGRLAARVVAAATTQEEIGTRGAITAAFSENPDFAIAVDVGYATDSPDCDVRKYGSFKQGAAPLSVAGQTSTRSFSSALSRSRKRTKFPTSWRPIRGRPERMRGPSGSRKRESPPVCSRFRFAICTRQARWLTCRILSTPYSSSSRWPAP